MAIRADRDDGYWSQHSFLVMDRGGHYRLARGEFGCSIEPAQARKVIFQSAAAVATRTKLKTRAENFLAFLVSENRSYMGAFKRIGIGNGHAGS